MPILNCWINLLYPSENQIKHFMDENLLSGWFLISQNLWWSSSLFFPHLMSANSTLWWFYPPFLPFPPWRQDGHSYRSHPPIDTKWFFSIFNRLKLTGFLYLNFPFLCFWCWIRSGLVVRIWWAVSDQPQSIFSMQMREFPWAAISKKNSFGVFVDIGVTGELEIWKFTKMID